MCLRPPRSTRTDTRCPYTTRFRSPDSSLFRFVTRDANGRAVLELPVVRETLPGGATFDTIDMRPGYVTDDYGPIKVRSEEHTSELQSLMRTSYAVFCLKQKKKANIYRPLRTQTRKSSHTYLH